MEFQRLEISKLSKWEWFGAPSRPSVHAMAPPFQIDPGYILVFYHSPQALQFQGATWAREPACGHFKGNSNL